MAAVLSQFQVGPAPDNNRVSRMALRLSYFDMLWLHAPPAQRLLYYRIPGITQTQFLNDVVSELRWSLSETFRNYLPMAGTLTIPKTSDPEILWVDGDSVALTAAESAADFDSLTADHAINCSDLHHLVPELKETVTDSGSTVSDLIAVQITLFPEKGFSIGVTNHAAAGDGNTMYRFMMIWSANARSGGIPETKEVRIWNGGKEECKKVEYFRVTKMLPFYYRNIMEDPEGIAKTYRKQWDEILKSNLQSGISSNISSTEKLRRTFSMSFNNVKSLKALYPKRSTFQVACAYAWSCLVKSRQEEEEDDENYDENRESKLVCFLDCRTRAHCMADWNYFGNCLAVCLAVGRQSELVKEEAVGYGAGLIRSAFDTNVRKGEDRVDISRSVDGPRTRAGAKEWLVRLRSVDLEKQDEMVANSSGFNFYKMRFSWGRPVRFEYVSIDKMGAFSLCGTKFYRFGKAKGGDRPRVEVCVCLPKESMDAFAAAFHEGLKDIPAPAPAQPDDEPIEPNAEIDEPDAEIDEPNAEIDSNSGVPVPTESVDEPIEPNAEIV